MISGALLVWLLVGFSVGVPLRRQEGDGKFGYEYDVKHPGGNSRVHVRAGGERHGKSYPAEYVSDASYINPHYVDPHYQPTSYGHYPTHYNRVPPHGYRGQKIPVYEERAVYPKPDVYQQIPHSGPKTYGFYPHAQEISQSNIDVEPFYEKPATDPVYSSPQFVQQAAIDDSGLGKIEQIPLNPKPTYDEVPLFEKVEQIPSEPAVIEQLSDLHEPQLPLKKDTPVIVPNPPLDQQVLVDEPEEISVISQEPVLSQVSEDIPPPKVIVEEPETPIVQQSSVDVPPPISAVKYFDDDVVVQQPLGPKPSIKTAVEPPVVQQVAVDYADVPPAKPLSYSDDNLHRSGNPIIQTTLDKYPSQTSYDSGNVYDHNPTPFHAAPPKYEFVPFGPPYEKISHSTEIIHGPPRNAYPVKLPPPPLSTKSIAPPLPQQQEHIDEPLGPPVPPSVKLPPPPVTKSVGPAILPHAQEIVEVPIVQNPQSVKLPPPPAQEHVDIPLTKNPQSVKLPPPPSPVTKSLGPPVLTQAQEHIEVPLTKNTPVLQSVKLPPPPPPITKSVVSPHVQKPINVLPKYPPVSHSVKHPPPSVPIYNSPPLYKPVGGIKAPPYAKGPLARYPPVSHSVKQPYARSYYVKSPHVSKPPLSYAPLTKSPVPYSVKRPYAPPPVSPYPHSPYGNPHIKSPYVKAPVTKTSPILYGVKQPVVSNTHSVKHPQPVSSVKGYPSVKTTPHLAQSSHAEEPLPESVPISPSVKHPYNTAPQYDSPAGGPHVKYPPQPNGPVKKYLPIGQAFETSHSEPKYEPELSISPEVPYPSEEKSPLQKYPPVSHAFQISPAIPPPETKLESSVYDDTFSSSDTQGASPLDKYPPVSHSIRLPINKPPTTTVVPNLFAAVPSTYDEDDDVKVSIESPLSEKQPVSHSVILPSSISEPKVSALRSDALSSPVSHPVRVGGRRNRERFEEPKQDFPAFPVESAYKYPDPVSDKVAHLSNSFRPRGSYANSHYEPDESESSNSPSVKEAKLEIDRVNEEIGLSFGDRIPAKSRL